MDFCENQIRTKTAYFINWWYAVKIKCLDLFYIILKYLMAYLEIQWEKNEYKL